MFLGPELLHSLVVVGARLLSRLVTDYPDLFFYLATAVSLMEEG